MVKFLWVFLCAWWCQDALATVYVFTLPKADAGAEWVQVYASDRALAKELIYQGPPSRLRVNRVDQAPLWYRFCEDSQQCSRVQALQPGPETNPSNGRLALSKTRRSSTLRKAGRKLQADGVRFLGAIDLFLDKLAPCDNDGGPLLATYSLRVPGLGTVEVQHQVTKRDPGGGWSWIGRNRQKNIVATFAASDCTHRPFGSVRTTKGTIWIRPLAQDGYGVYKMAY